MTLGPAFEIIQNARPSVMPLAGATGARGMLAVTVFGIPLIPGLCGDTVVAQPAAT
ncbi:hypothetical protein [Jannaschia donghaensis]|uniref:hypothetical protein n=1 Tax=Jannaschia donghaensis TaxID=420998 RepID=UPI000A46E802|nr:hypothetical protein [Jannaschia donghaensis]